MDDRHPAHAPSDARSTRTALRLRTHPLRWTVILALAAHLPWIVAAAFGARKGAIWIPILGCTAMSGAVAYHVNRGYAGLVERLVAAACALVLPAAVVTAYVLVRHALEPSAGRGVDWLLDHADEVIAYFAAPGAAGYFLGPVLRGRHRVRRSAVPDGVLAAAGFACLALPTTLTGDEDKLAAWGLLGGGLAMLAFHRRVTAIAHRGWPVLGIATLSCGLALITLGRQPNVEDSLLGVLIAAAMAVPLFAAARLASSLTVPPPEHPLRADFAREVG